MQTTKNATTTTEVQEKAPRFKKSFNELSPSGQKSRLKKYEEERKEKGTLEAIGRLSRKPVIKANPNSNDKHAYFSLAIYNEETEKMEYPLFSAFIAEGKDALENFYETLPKGQLLKVEYKKNGQYNNVWGAHLRTKKAKPANA